jgi:hypothetical protein
MSRYESLAAAFLIFCAAALPGLAADDQALWREFGLQQTTTAKAGRVEATIYRMKDLTGALAAWEWQRSPQAHACSLAAFCSADGARTVISDANYLVSFNGTPAKAQVDALLNSLPNRHDSALPAILTFVPRGELIPNTARYVLGSDSLAAFAPELSSVKVGFEQGAEAQVAQYKSASGPPLHLAVFYYPTPEMARLHAIDFKTLSNVHVKRSSILVALVYGGATDQQAESLLARIQYEAKVTWNEIPPPSPIKPMFLLLRNIIFLSLVLSALCLAAGIVYACLRIYRRRYGTLEDEEAMTTLHLSGE